MFMVILPCIVAPDSMALALSSSLLTVVLTEVVAGGGVERARGAGTGGGISRAGLPAGDAGAAGGSSSVSWKHEADVMVEVAARSILCRLFWSIVP